jgi:hypothetical protein
MVLDPGPASHVSRPVTFGVALLMRSLATAPTPSPAVAPSATPATETVAVEATVDPDSVEFGPGNDTVRVVLTRNNDGAARTLYMVENDDELIY